jgi:hypothetical protein
MAEIGDLLTQVLNLQTSALGIMQEAERVGDLRTALSAVLKARSSLELLARPTGELDGRAQSNILLAPKRLEFRTLVLGALPLPEGETCRGGEPGNARRGQWVAVRLSRCTRYRCLYTWPWIAVATTTTQVRSVQSSPAGPRQ